MNINIFLGGEIISEDLTKFINEIFCSKIQALRTQLKNDFNIEVPLININDNSQLAKREIALEIDGTIEWKQDFSGNEDFNTIIDIIIRNLKK